MLSKEWNKRREKYDFIVIGSGYGGAIMAARIACSPLDPPKTVCILERGKEWPVGTFPDTFPNVTGAVLNPLSNPLGLYDFLTFPDISVVKGSGLGGTSLVNANVAIVPDEEVFKQIAWPRTITLAELTPHYQSAALMLAARPHPRATQLLKVKALERRALEIGNHAFGLNLAVNFDIDGENPHGVQQKPCIDCGDCVTGCNVGAKNTLYMNYLPMAQTKGADIFTQTQVDWVEKLDDGGWRVHGRRFSQSGPFPIPEGFTLEGGSVILSGGALGTTEILLRSEIHGLSLSPSLGSNFSGNGDFFGVAYNADYQTNVLGFGNDPNCDWRKNGNAPGPTIVGAIRYDANLPLDKKITVEDCAFPKAYVSASMLALGGAGGVDTDVGDEMDELARRKRDNPLAPYQQHNAMNHTMFYLVMGHDDAKGTIYLNTDFLDPKGRIQISWDNAGRQPLFTRINEELRRHARALGAHFISNPMWSFTSLRNLITAHPLGGCALGEDYMQGVVDEFGRVFAGDGNIHEGLFVADGSLIPTALGVNPFLTISALSERIADRLVKNLKGQPYPSRSVKVNVPVIDPLEAINYRDEDLEGVYSRVETKGIETMVNTGQRSIDVGKGIVRNDTIWKGFFPRGYILNQVAHTFFTGFKKKFTETSSGIFGVTSDSDERINVDNTLQEITITERAGTLEPGKYILLRYGGAPWSAFYDIFKVINNDLLIGRVYLGEYPNGTRLFTFPMTRVYGLDNMTVDDHRYLYNSCQPPAKEQLAGLWEMHAVSNSINSGTVAFLKFDLKPDGRFEARYLFLGLIEGITQTTFGQDHFQLNDFTTFHDEIRYADRDFLVGKYITNSPPTLMELLGPKSLGLFHQETTSAGTTQFGFYYTLRRAKSGDLPPTGFLEPLLDIRLPDGLGMTFDEEMTGYLFPGFSTPAGRLGDLQIEAKVPASGQPAGGISCSFRVTMTVRDLNEFFDSPEHEAQLQGTIHFGDFIGQGPADFNIDPQKSYFNYLRVNPDTQEVEMLYHLYFHDGQNKEYLLFGRKYMQKDLSGGGIGAMQEALHDYTTLYSHLTETASGNEIGTGLLKFRTFEDPRAVGNFASFLGSFQVTGTSDAFLKAQGQLRFLAFTNQFIIREYDPLGL